MTLEHVPTTTQKQKDVRIKKWSLNMTQGLRQRLPAPSPSLQRADRKEMIKAQEQEQESSPQGKNLVSGFPKGTPSTFTNRRKDAAGGQTAAEKDDHNVLTFGWEFY